MHKIKLRRFYSKALQDFHPSSHIKLFKNANPTNNESVELRSESAEKICVEASNSEYDSLGHSSEYAENAFKIQMISKNLHQQIFGQIQRIQPERSIHAQQLIDELRKYGVNIQNIQPIPDVMLKLPSLKGGTIETHFYQIAKKIIKPYEELLLPLVECKVLPKRPDKWVFREGWTAYDPNIGTCTQVEYPKENALLLDVEVCMQEGSAPTIAIAVGKKCWYSWVSHELISSSRKSNIIRQQRIHYTLTDFITLGLNGPKIIVGHNVSFDRARIREEYSVEDTRARFLDTMSLHVCVSGVTSYQRSMLNSKKEPNVEDMEWLSQSALNSLVEVHNLYCGGEKLSKEARNVFMEGTLTDISADFQNLVNYCASDVEATHRVLQVLYPLYQQRFPHPVTLAGMLEMGSAYLPVNFNWLRYINESNLAYEDLSIEAKYHLSLRADEACALLTDEKYRHNIWLWDEDWSVQQLKLRQPKIRVICNTARCDNNTKYRPLENERDLKLKFQYLYDTRTLLPVRRPLLPGYPKWYRKLCQKPPKYNIEEVINWKPGATDVSTGMRIAPKLLSLCWEGYPLYYHTKHGWGFLAPFRKEVTFCNSNFSCIPIEDLAKRCLVIDCQVISASEDKNFLNSLDGILGPHFGTYGQHSKIKNSSTSSNYYGSGVWCNEVVEECCYFFKLPHKNGDSFRVGNPLSKDFINKFSENVMSSGHEESDSAARVLEIARMLSYWRNNKDRIMHQLVVWFPSNKFLNSMAVKERGLTFELGAICPQVVVCGTLTRRAMEPTWMTASNSKQDRIGSELRAMVQAPPSYKIVGADVDSQELWIASVLGDAHACGLHGGTPFGWMTLSGTKAHGTDMHSLTAKAVGISRNHAKIINYARIYGAGQIFAERLLRQFNPSFSVADAKNKAKKMFTITKGKKVFRLRKEFLKEYENKNYTSYEAMKIAETCNCSVAEIFERPRWQGGTESAMFNRLEEIASEPLPVTPFLRCRLSRALEPHSTDENRFLPTRINWVVQSGAVDFLHLMLVSMRWLMGPHARFCLSFHDELRYLVKEDKAYKAALAMHITNLLTRAFCASRLGLSDLPMSVAFFSSVEVDNCLRKESTMDCKTPSNLHGLQIGYGIPPGESLTIYDAIKKVGSNDISEWEWLKNCA